MNPMLNIAIRAARKAGNIIAKNYERRDDIETMEKSKNDYVTNVDKASEAAIIEVIKKSYPEHTIITEESGALEGSDNDVQWVIDPLDGTTNFVKGLPHFAVSIAIRVKGRTEVGVVYDPILNELFTAVRGEGAKLNELRLRVENKRDFSHRFSVQTNQIYVDAIQHDAKPDCRRGGFPSCRLRCVGSLLCCGRSRRWLF